MSIFALLEQRGARDRVIDYTLSLDLAALHRQINVMRTRIAGDDLELQAEKPR